MTQNENDKESKRYLEASETEEEHDGKEMKKRMTREDNLAKRMSKTVSG
jgi:hypothetical protein